MKKITVVLVLLLVSFPVCSQVLNQSAAWPNVNWTVTGVFNTDPLAFEADPTITANFAFDDDDAGNGNDDDIAAESPVIDLTAAHTASETFLEVTVDYTYNDLQDTLTLEYWDADAGAWQTWELFVATADQPTNDFCAGARDSYTSVQLDILAFTPAQLSGFRYRISFLDDGGLGGPAWEWGFCFDSPTITSISSLSVEEFEANGFTYFPNPVNNTLTLKAQSYIQSIAVYNMLGQEVLRTTPNTMITQVNMQSLQTGAYFVRATISEASSTIRIIKH